MKAERTGPKSRTVKFTEVPAEGDGAKDMLPEMEVSIRYEGQGNAEKGITLDNAVIPGIIEAVNRPADTLTVTLEDNNDSLPVNERRKVKVTVRHENGFLHIMPEGYGEPEAAKGHGAPVFLELYEGVLRVIVSPDILDKSGKPTKIISLEGAREDRVTDWEE
jgi:hypothetical protein